MDNKSTYGEGTAYILKDGRHGIALSLGVDEETGKRIRLVGTGKTEELAKASLKKKMDALRVSQGHASEEEIRLTITGESRGEDFVDEYILARILPRIGHGISSRTANDYILYLNKFKEAAKQVRVSNLDVTFLNGFFRDMVEAREETGDYRYGQVALRRAIIAIKPMFERATKKKWFEQNAFNDVDFIEVKSKKEKKKEVEALDEEELVTILSIIKENKVLYTLIRLMLATGMRTEEAIALNWKNIDFKTGKISIEKVITLDYKYNERGEVESIESVVAKTKTEKSKRVLLIDDIIIGLLKRWREWASVNTKTDMSPNGFVFGNTSGPRWTYSGLRSSVKKCLKKGGYTERFGLHQIRHTVGTMLAEDGRSEVQIMHQLGITQSSVVQRYISHTDLVAQENCCSIQNKLTKIGI